ncbi:nuclear hormone receptor HR96-like isoform X2 [Panonychus citri]|uniref:nuclear hormone receptor HR96-like isoform X2 n=1 Tax=Panonychus citri TaxID=50023 RepID=UPI002307A268|nr:nuclear hormone receptor HR96-like isoform X2 [Panonychus citri]XP_053203608.1 nuclear hormone receptor HR96-like isoform X2 [Panonychus citri]
MIQVVGEGNRQKICRVCSDRAMGFNFNAITCESCKAFFRRNAFKSEKLRCPFNNDCIIDKSTRRFCQKCRLEKCLQVGMKKEWILSEEQKKIKRAKIAENRLKRKIEDPNGSDGPSEEKSSSKSTDKMEHFSTSNSDHPISSTSPSFSPSYSSSSSSQYGDDSLAYRSSPGNSHSSPFTGSLTRKESTGGYDFSLDSLLAPKPNQQSLSVFKPISTIVGTSDSPVNSGTLERYNNLKTLTTNSLIRDSLDANWVSLITDPSTNQSGQRKSCLINHILENNNEVIDYHHQGNLENIKESTDPIHHHRLSPTSLLLQFTTADCIRSQLEPTNNSNDDNRDEIEESWKLKVNHRILEANFTPIYLRNAKDESVINGSLNELETAKINELIQSFSVIDEPILDHSCAEDSRISDVIKFSDLAIRRLIKWCKKINAFSSLCLDDQMALLKAGCLEMLSMKASFNFNPDNESWQDTYTKNGVKLTVFRQASEKLYQAHRQFIRTFNQRWRTDHKVNLLLVAIVLFNPDRPNLLHPATVRLEHYTYIYLLRRYLETKSDSLCQARSDHYHLMMKIEDLRELHEKTLRLYSDAGPEVVGPLLIEILDLK